MKVILFAVAALVLFFSVNVSAQENETEKLEARITQLEAQIQRLQIQNLQLENRALKAENENIRLQNSTNGFAMDVLKLLNEPQVAAVADTTLPKLFEANNTIRQLFAQVKNGK